MPASMLYLAMLMSIVAPAPTQASSLHEEFDCANQMWTYCANGSGETSRVIPGGTDAAACEETWLDVEGYGDCGLTEQSPINIITADIEEDDDSLYALDLHGEGCNKFEQLVNDHVYEVLMSDDCQQNSSNTIEWNNETFTLKQFHFHAVSEHTVDGVFADSEVHLVHLSESGQALVIGAFLQADSPKDNEFVSFLHEMIETSDMESIDPYTAFLPSSKSYKHYHGSFTTPPCTEDTLWILLDETISISEEQLTWMSDTFDTLCQTEGQGPYFNNRPTQAMNGRVVTHYTQEAAAVEEISDDPLAGLNVLENPTDGNAFTTAAIACAVYFALLFVCICCMTKGSRGSREAEETNKV